MNEKGSNMDDKLKEAELNKLNAEIDKLKSEAEKNRRSDRWLSPTVVYIGLSAIAVFISLAFYFKEIYFPLATAENVILKAEIANTSFKLNTTLQSFDREKRSYLLRTNLLLNGIDSLAYSNKFSKLQLSIYKAQSDSLRKELNQVSARYSTKKIAPTMIWDQSRWGESVWGGEEDSIKK